MTRLVPIDHDACRFTHDMEVMRRMASALFTHTTTPHLTDVEAATIAATGIDPNLIIAILKGKTA